MGGELDPGTTVDRLSDCDTGTADRFPCRIAEYCRFWASDESLLYDFTEPSFLCCEILIMARVSTPAWDSRVMVVVLTL